MSVVARVLPMIRVQLLRQPATLELNYRFELSPEARPGTYPWPVTVSANAA